MHLFLHLAQVEIKSTTSKNKFYRIQLIEAPPGQFDVWTRWGRVGETGDTALLGDKNPFNSQAEAIKAFEKKFNDKTKNKWANRSTFVLKDDAYDMLEMDLGAIVAPVAVNAAGVKTDPCTLDKVTQSLVELVFDKDMFNKEMKRMNIETDPAKMPLGRISASQIAKGVGVLDELQVEFC